MDRSIAGAVAVGPGAHAEGTVRIEQYVAQQVIIGGMDDAESAADEVARLRRLLPVARTHECSLLAMILSKFIAGFPVLSIRDNEIVEGRSLLDVYKVVEALVGRFEELCDQILDVLGLADIENNFYGSAGVAREGVLLRANRRMLSVASDMRGIARSLGGILKGSSIHRAQLEDVLRVVATISVLEDFVVLRIGCPVALPSGEALQDSIDRYSGMVTGEIPGMNMEDSVHTPCYSPEDGAEIIRDFNRALVEIGAYKDALRETIAGLSTAAKSQ